MPKVISFGSVTIKKIAVRSIMLFEDADGKLQVDYCYDRVDVDGGVYDTLHYVVAAPTPPMSFVALWNEAKAVVERADAFASLGLA